MTLYNGGGMTTYPKQLMMKEVKQYLEEAGIEVYDPASQPFNNKTDVGNDDIAIKIVAKDTEAIYNSDIRLMNTQEDNLGTCIEAGIIKGYTDHATVVLQIIEKMKAQGNSDGEVLDKLFEFCEEEMVKEYVPYHTDIRIHDQPESGFKRSVGFHQFLRGVNLLLGEYHNDVDDSFDGFLSLNDALEYTDSLSEKRKPSHGVFVSVDTNGRINTHITSEKGS